MFAKKTILAAAALSALTAMGIGAADAQPRDHRGPAVMRHEIQRPQMSHARVHQTLRQHFEDRWMRLLDRGLLAFCADEAGDLTVVISRDRAWDRAVRLAALSGGEFDEETAEIDREAARIGWALLELSVR